MIACRHRRSHGSSLSGALVLVFIGFIFLAGTMLPAWSFAEMIGRGWPILLIVVGFVALVGNVVKAPFRGRLDLVGPLVLITLGGLFALQSFRGVGFDRTWPILLVVIGLGVVFNKIATVPLLLFLRRRP